MHDVIRLKQVDHVKNEKNILSEIHHPFIVDLLWFHKDKNLLYMLFPYVCGGELFSYLRRLLQITWLTSLIYGNLKISANYSTKVCDILSIKSYNRFETLKWHIGEFHSFTLITRSYLLLSISIDNKNLQALIYAVLILVYSMTKHTLWTVNDVLKRT